MRVSIARDRTLPGVSIVYVTIDASEADIVKLADSIAKQYSQLMDIEETKFLKRHFSASTPDAGETALTWDLLMVPADPSDMSNLVPAFLKIGIKMPAGPDDVDTLLKTASKILPPELLLTFRKEAKKVGIPIPE